MKAVKVRDPMLSKRHAISDQTTPTDAVRILKEIQLPGLPIVDDSEHVVGFLSEQDCVKQILESSYHRDDVVKVTKVMQPKVLSVAPGDSMVDVAKRMITDKPKIYPVIEDGLLVGVITRANILRTLEHLKTL